MVETLIAIVVVGFAVLVPYYYWYRVRSHSKQAEHKLKQAEELGLIEPVSLHPLIDPNGCISTGACLSACPEKGILGIVNGRAVLVSPSKCIGHGACQTACPVNAISLVFGTARRGVDIPHISENFETNVPGIYIAGELGGMGLIRNAVTQGREAVEYIAGNNSSNGDDILDLVIVGAGPAGLSAALQAKLEGLRAVTLEQEDEFGGAIITYPRQKLVMTQPMIIPEYGHFNKPEVFKEELVELWKNVVKNVGVKIVCSEKVESINRGNGHFVLQSNKNSYTTKKILLAVGRRGTPRKLNVEGEKSAKVAYKLIEPDQYVGADVLVVGGGDSAIEAACMLSEQDGTKVTLSYRKDIFSRIKEGNRVRVDEAVKKGSLTIIFESQVKKIEPESVILDCKGEEMILKNDYVFVFIGGELPTAFLNSLGIRMETKYGQR